MKKIFILFCILFVTVQLPAIEVKSEQAWGAVETMYLSVQNQLEHDIRDYEKVIIDTTYLHYFNKCNGVWTREIWDEAVNKSVEMCRNNAAVAAAKSGVFGEKLLQTLAVTAEDALSGFNKWIQSGSEKFKERHNR